jgi:hypothetical protein
VQNLLPSNLLSKHLKINIYRTLILPVVLYGCETWSSKLRKERRLRVFENRVLKRIFGPKRDEAQRGGENYIMRSLMICSPRPIFLGDKLEMNEMGGACSTYGGEERRIQGFGGEI